MKRKKIRRVILITVLLLLLVVILIPLVWCIVLSFDRKALSTLPEFSLLPHEFSLFNYEVAFNTIPLVRYYMNTIFVTVVHTFLAVFFALMCGYAFAKGKFVGKQFWFIFMLAVMMIPFESRMVPLYLQYKSWGLLDTYAPLLMGACAYVYGIFFARQNIEAIPDSLRESAYIDGASAVSYTHLDVYKRQEEDLAKALHEGKVYAAACDVVSTEPIRPDNPLLGCYNSILTPHIAWAPKESRQRLMDVAVANLKAFVEGKWINVVN